MANALKSVALQLRLVTAIKADAQYIHRHTSSVSRASSMDKLPVELCELVLQHLPEMFAWRCRLVCRAWRHYIEEVLSRDWLIGSRLLMMYINHPRMLVLDTSENRDMRLTRGDLVLDLVERQDDFLVFRFTASSSRTLSHLSKDSIRAIRDFWPAVLTSNSRRRSLLPCIKRRSRSELKLYIWTLSVAPPIDLVPDMRLLTLRASPSSLFSTKKVRQDFRLQPPDSLLVRRRVLFSKLFGEAEDQDVKPALPFLAQSL